MGTHIVFSGGALKQLPIAPELLLSHLVKNGGSIVRLDLAIDCINCMLNPSDATEEIKNDRVTTLARQFPLWFDPTKKGYTQYIGKKTSTAFVRIYNKAAEMGVDGDWARVECVFSGRRAMDAAMQALQGTDYRALVRGFVDFSDWKEWSEIMSIAPSKTNSPRTVSNTKRWLLASAATSMARELYLDGDDAFYFQWIDHMRFFLDKLRAGENEQEDSNVS
jgi:hypothetical protein